MADRIGYLMESGYETEDNVVRHGDVLRDRELDQVPGSRILGLIGMSDVQAVRSQVLKGSSPVAYFVVDENGSITMSKARYTNSHVTVYGLDTDLLNVRQAIRVEMFGFTVLSVITLTEG